jgi:CDP-glycerol glycerophosphotransferase
VARISVVVPIYDVEDYLEDCLRSIAGQTHDDLEVVMVDDGSTDASAAIAERFARHDPRFTLIRQPNAGLGAARNTGLDAASGEYLAFADSDDVLPPDAYERLLSTLERTGSDFATGNVQRLSSEGCTQAAFLAATFARPRPRTHVRHFAPLLADRTAWNKLWRRSFWDRHGLRFPEGRLHEDIPVIVPAHFLARSVDVVSAPVYHYRVRENGAPSITQRRHELRALRDRLAAIEEVHDFLVRHESRRHRRRYERSVVAGDLRYHLDLLGDATDEYRHVFLERANAFLDGAQRGVCDRLPAIERLKWHLVRRRMLPELLEVLRFQREEALATPPLRARGRYYGDFPFRTDRRLRIPRSVCRLGRRDQELALTAHLEDLRVDDGKLRLRGHAFVNALGADQPDSQRVAIAAVRPGRWRPLRLRMAALGLATAPGRRADLEPRLSWAGFRASLEPDALRERDGGWTDGRWDLFAYVRSGPVRRRRARFVIADPGLVRTVEVPGPGDALVRATARADGSVCLDVGTRWVRIERHRLLPGGVLELEGVARNGDGAAPVLELARAGEPPRVAYPLRAGADGAFVLRLPLVELRGAAEWELAVAGGLPVVLGEAIDGAAWRSAGREMELASTPTGGVRLVERRPVPEPVPAPEPALARSAAR